MVMGPTSQPFRVERSYHWLARRACSGTSDLHGHTKRISGFEALAEYLEFVELSGSPVRVLRTRVSRLQHDAAPDVAQAAEEHVSLMSGDTELQYSIVHVFDSSGQAMSIVGEVYASIHASSSGESETICIQVAFRRGCTDWPGFGNMADQPGCSAWH